MTLLSRGLVIAITCGVGLLASGGCTASGKALLVKISPDSRWVVCQDARYPSVHLHSIASGKSETLPGVVVYVDSTMQHLITVPSKHPVAYYGVAAASIQPVLIELLDGRAIQQPLPKLAPGFEMLQVFFDRNSASGEVAACLYGGQTKAACRAYLSWKPGQAQWTALPFPERPFAEYYDYLSKGCRGAIESGPVFCPIPDVIGVPAYPPGEGDSPDRYGLGLKEDVRWLDQQHTKSRTTYLMTSPDGKSIIHLWDPDDPWERVTLVDVASGRKTILVEKNDAAAGVYEALVERPLAVGALFLMLLSGHTK